MMKSLRTLALAIFVTPLLLQAQVAVNPQVGLNWTKLTDAPAGSDYKADVGFMIGSDFRFGDRLYLQPGVFYISTATAINTGDSIQLNDDLVLSFLKLKALVGYNLIDGDGFRLRLNAGPTYGVLMSAKTKDGKIPVDKDNFTTGSFNLDAGLGADISILTLETGISYGLSKAYKDQGGFSSDSRYFTFYVTMGVAFGGARK